MKSKIKFLSLIIISSLLISGCTTKYQQQNLNMNSNDIPTPSQTITTSSNTPKNDSIVSIKTKDGEIILKLYQDQAPNTVANFIKKANDGFYKGLIFHRVIPSFMAQGGDPIGTGTGGGNQKSEINNIPFVRGTIGLARGGDKTISNDSQFFICFTTEGCQHLTGDYVNFGEVIFGLDVLDKINQGDNIIDITTKTK
ncbi:MAG: peptidylprolyl isomerase [Candidatus Shapirobacteria bacterium]|jgi:cyclophilin family peptidyl-prolyl cis-trans isomerase